MWETAGRPGRGAGRCARRGWPVGTHAMATTRSARCSTPSAGDRARVGDALRPDLLVVEHGGLIRPDHIAQARGRSACTSPSQQALARRARRTFFAGVRRGTGPATCSRCARPRSTRASESARAPTTPSARSIRWRGVHGMTTRATPAGVLGPEHAISRAEALRLYTVAGARFLGGEHTGTLVTGAPADLVAYRADPFTCPDADCPPSPPPRHHRRPAGSSGRLTAAQRARRDDCPTPADSSSPGSARGPRSR